MAKETLEKKIQQVGFWTFGCVFWYLVIAFFLKSSYPIYDYDFNFATAYDVLKDALTLAAAFLAPVAAFVLFSDWRDEHKTLSNTEQSRRFNEEFKRCLDRVEADHDVFYRFETAEFESFMRLLFDFAATASNALKNIYDIDEESIVYKKNITLINKKFENLYNSIQASILYVENKQQLADSMKNYLLNSEVDSRRSIIQELRSIDLLPLKV